VKKRHHELLLAFLCVAAAVVIAVLATPFPPLSRWIRDDDWTRFAEVVVLTLVFWMALAALGFVPTKFSFSTTGVTIERIEIDDKATATAVAIKNDTIELVHDVARLEGIVEVLCGQLTANTARIDRALSVKGAGGAAQAPP
jgi:hypothetical protein